MGSWNNAKYSFSSKVGYVDFYGSLVDIIRTVISGSVSVDVSVQEILLADAAVSGNVDFTATVREVVDAQSSISGGVVVASVSIEVLNILSLMSISSDVTVDSLKLATASSTINVTSDSSSTAKEVLLASSSLSSDISMSVTGRKGQLVSSTSSVTSSTVVSGTSVALGSASINVDSNLSAGALEILLAQFAADVSAEVDVVSVKVSKADASLDISSSVSVSAIKFAAAQSSVEILSNFVSVIRQVRLAAANLDQTAFVFAVVSETLLANISIGISSRFLIAGATCFNASRSGEDVRTPRTLIVIDDLPLSEHNRKMTSGVVRSFVENVNWESSKNRYYKNSSGRRTFDISWSYLPGERDDTADLRFGRNKIQSIASDPDVHTVKILNFDTDGENPYSEDSYTVMVTGYSENLIRRDVSNGVYLWDCQLQLEEV